MKRGMGAYHIDKAEKSEVKIYQALSSGSWVRYREIVDKTGLGTTTISKFLKIMRENGEVDKKIDVKSGEYPYPVLYKLTNDGKVVLEKLDAQREAAADVVMAKSLDEKKPENIEEEVARRLHAHGSALDLEKPRGALELVISGGLLGFKDLIRAYLKLDLVAKEYLRFLSRLYVHSVRNFLGKEGSKLGFTELRLVWQIVGRNAFKGQHKGEGLDFNFEEAWKRLENQRSDKLKKKMEEFGQDQERVFKRLRAFSYPIPERIRLASKGLI